MPVWLGLTLRRALQALAIALLVGTLCFFMVRALPGDIAYRIAASRYGYDLVSVAAAEAVRAELGLDRPLWQALAIWLGDLLRLNFGQSLVTSDPVIEEIAHQLGHTALLALTAVALAALLGVPLGLAAGLRPGTWFDRASLALAVIFRATPPFLLALLLMLLVAVQLGALPVAGHGEPAHLWLPALTLALGLAAGLCRVSRAAMRAVAASPAFEFARTKGLNDVQALWRHGVRNAAIPIVAYLGVNAVFLIEGTVVVETLFAWPGIGHALVHAIFARDVPMIQGTALMMALLFVAMNWAADLACAALDPRIARA